MFNRSCLWLGLVLALVAGCGSLTDIVNRLSGSKEQVEPVSTKLLMTAVPPPGVGASGTNNSLGTLKVTSGEMIIDTDTAVMMLDTDVYQGDVIKQDVPQTSAFSNYKGDPSVAVFNFDSMTIGPDVKITVRGKPMLALVSQGDATVSASLDISGGNGQASSGGAGRIGGGIGVTAAQYTYPSWGPFGNPFGQQSSPPKDPYSDYTPMGRGVGGSDFGGTAVGVGGGGFGGTGGNGGGLGSSTGGSHGGATYGDLAAMLEGGSGGGSGKGGGVLGCAGGGGAGGGTILIASNGKLTVSGTILSNGGNGANAGYTGYAGGGGGSGGGIVLCGKTLAVTGVLSACGGNSGQPITCSGSGGGGGGRMVLYVPTLNPAEVTLTGSFTAAGGSTAGGWPGQNGQAGTCDLLTDLLVVQQGQTFDSKTKGSLSLMCLASQVDAGGSWIVTNDQTVQTLVGGGQVTLSNSKLTLGDADASCEFSGILSGNGQMVKTGAGTLTLSGTSGNTCSGATTVAGGVLLLRKDSGVALAGDVTINSGTLRLGRAESIADTRSITVTNGLFDMRDLAETLAGLTIAAQGTTKVGTGRLTVGSLNGAGTLVGTGSELYVGGGTFQGTIGGEFTLVKTGSGTLSLQGNNCYTGQTMLTAGTLAAGSDAVLSDPQTPLVFSGGTLQVTGASWHSTAHPITWQGGGIDVAEGSNTFTISQALAGQGMLTKLGAGTLVLTGQNTYIGGTTVNRGTLRGPAGSLPGNIINNATLTFDQATDEMFAGNISGTGTLTKTGTSSLSLGGTNSYQGATSLQTGTLKAVGQGSLPAASAVTIANGANLELSADGTDYTVASAISGAGTLTKTGSGKVQLTGTLTYTGPTQVAAGTLTVPLSSLATSSAINILQDGCLETHGSTATNLSTSVGTIKADGGLTLGNAAAAGSYTFAGTLDVGSQIVYLCSADQVVLGKAALLSGGKLMVATGLKLDAGKPVSGHGQIRGDVDLGNGGTIHGDSSGSRIAIYGDVTGTGTLINVNVYGDVASTVTQTVQ